MDLKHIRFRMSHGCFTNQITERHPGLKITGNIIGRWAGGPVVRLHLDGDYNPDAILEKMNTYESVRAPTFENKEKRTIVAKLEKDEYISQLIQDYGFSMCTETAMMEGVEYWDVSCFDNPKEFYSRLKEAGEVKILSTERIALESTSNRLKALSGVTEKQLESLKAVVGSGYYDFPRRAKLETIAERVGISRSTLQEQVQRAESRIIKNLFDPN